MLAVSALAGRIATFKRNTILFEREEVENWRRLGHRGVFLLSGKGLSGLLIHLTDITPLNNLYLATSLTDKTRVDALNIGLTEADVAFTPRRVNLVSRVLAA